MRRPYNKDPRRKPQPRLSDEDILQAQDFYDPEETSITAFLTHYKVMTKRIQAGTHSVAVKFELREAQEILLRIIEEQWAAGHTAKILVLKDRTQGISTLVQALMWERLCRGGGGKGRVVSHKEDATAELFGKVSYFCRQTPEWSLKVGAEAEIARDRDNRLVLEFGSGVTGELKVQTSQDRAMGRGTENRWLHISEYPWWTRGKAELGGLLESSDEAGDSPGNFIVIESTANGMDAFYDMWMDAVEGRSTYVPVFFSWLTHPLKTLPFVDEEDRDAFVANIGTLPRYGMEEEKRLHERGVDISATGTGNVVKATPEQLHWRRRTIDDPKIRGDIKVFHREHPATPEQAFESTGNAWFNREIVKAWMPIAKRQHDEASVGNFHIEGSAVIWKEDPTAGIWRMFRPPKNGEVYGWAADTASGHRTHADGRTEADFPTCMMDHVKSKTTVLELRHHLKPRAHAREILKAAIYYGKAHGYGERSAVGDQGTMLSKLEDMSIGPVMGEEILESSERLVQSDRGEIVLPEIGFRTKPGTKRPLLEDFRDWVAMLGMPEPGAFCPFSYMTALEMMRYEETQTTTSTGRSTVRLKATSGHDDMVMTKAIGIYCCDKLLDTIDSLTAAEDPIDPEVLFYARLFAPQLAAGKSEPQAVIPELGPGF